MKMCSLQDEVRARTSFAAVQARTMSWHQPYNHISYSAYINPNVKRFRNVTGDEKNVEQNGDSKKPNDEEVGLWNMEVELWRIERRRNCGRRILK